MPVYRKISSVTAAAMAGFFGATVLVVPARDARADEVSSTGKGIVGGALLGAEAVSIVESLVGVRSGWAYGIGAIVGAGGGAVGGYFVEQGSTDGKAPTYMLAGGLALIIPAVVLTLNATRYLPEEGVTDDHPPVGPAAEPGSAPASAPAAPPASTAPPVEPAPPTPITPPPPSSFPSPSFRPRSAGADGASAEGGAVKRGDGASAEGGAVKRGDGASAEGGAVKRGPVPSQPVDRRSAQKARAPIPHSLLNMEGGAIRVGVPAIDVRPVFTAVEQRQYGTKNDTELRMPVVAVSF
jgi:hypothetical protein